MTKFYIDGIAGEYDGINLGRWNGWACPLFDKVEALRLMDALNAGDYGLTVTFDADKNAFIVNDANDGETSIFNEETQRGQTGFAIGAYSWCWNESEANHA